MRHPRDRCEDKNRQTGTLREDKNQLTGTLRPDSDSTQKAQPRTRNRHRQYSCADTARHSPSRLMARVHICQEDSHLARSEHLHAVNICPLTPGRRFFRSGRIGPPLRCAPTNAQAPTPEAPLSSTTFLICFHRVERQNEDYGSATAKARACVIALFVFAAHTCPSRVVVSSAAGLIFTVTDGEGKVIEREAGCATGPGPVSHYGGRSFCATATSAGRDCAGLIRRC